MPEIAARRAVKGDSLSQPSITRVTVCNGLAGLGNDFKIMETPAPYIVNGQSVTPRVESFRLKPKRVRYRVVPACRQRVTLQGAKPGRKAGRSSIRLP